MGRPQLGFPRLRVVAGRALGIAIGPDHTPPGVTVRQSLHRSGMRFPFPLLVTSALLDDPVNGRKTEPIRLHFEGFECAGFR